MPNRMPFEYDPPQAVPPLPDREALRLAHADMIKHESPQQRYVRQQWEVSISSIKVAMDAWRRVWPEQTSDQLPATQHGLAREIGHGLEIVYASLDKMADAIQGRLLTGAQRGHFGAEDVRNRLSDPELYPELKR